MKPILAPSIISVSSQFLAKFLPLSFQIRLVLTSWLFREIKRAGSSFSPGFFCEPGFICQIYLHANTLFSNFCSSYVGVAPFQNANNQHRDARVCSGDKKRGDERVHRQAGALHKRGIIKEKQQSETIGTKTSHLSRSRKGDIALFTLLY